MEGGRPRNGKKGRSLRATASAGDGSTSSLTVTYVEGTKKVLDHSDALFGIPAYQSGSAGLLYLPTGSDRNGTTGRVTGCAPFTDPSMARRIALIDRSGPMDSASCHFTTKVFNAQAAGATAVVVVDSQGLCTSASRNDPCGDCSQCPYHQIGSCQCQMPMMADSNGVGASVSIPSMMVSSKDGGALRGLASDPDSLPLVSMRWEIPAADGSVQLVVWQDSIDLAASAFRNTWALYVPYLGTTTRFQPHFYVRGRAILPPLSQHAPRAAHPPPSPLFSSPSSFATLGNPCRLLMARRWAATSTPPFAPPSA